MASVHLTIAVEELCYLEKFIFCKVWCSKQVSIVRGIHCYLPERHNDLANNGGIVLVLVALKVLAHQLSKFGVSELTRIVSTP